MTESGEKMNIQDYKGVFVFAQQEDNKLTGVSMELLQMGKRACRGARYGSNGSGACYEIGDMANKLGRYGANNVILADAPEA